MFLFALKIGYPGTHNVNQTGLELIETHLSLPLKACAIMLGFLKKLYLLMDMSALFACMLHTRREHPDPLQMVINYHMVSGN